MDRHPLIGNTVLLDRRIDLDILNEFGNHALGDGGGVGVSTAEITTLFAIVKSPILACVKRMSRKDATIVALDDFIFIPINREMKLMVTMVVPIDSCKNALRNSVSVNVEN